MSYDSIEDYYLWSWLLEYPLEETLFERIVARFTNEEK